MTAALHDLSPLEPAVVALGNALRAKAWRLATAESCTGGLIAAACTSVAGSSDWFERAFVTYSNASKVEMLGVDAALIGAHGAVSNEVARAMAQGAIARSQAELALAVTGIAGPGGATPDKPVGTVWIAWCRRGQPARAQHLFFGGTRASIRGETARAALEQALAVACHD